MKASSRRWRATRKRSRVLLSVSLVVLAAVSAACGGGEVAEPTTTTENPYGEALALDPPAPDEVILTVTGPNGTQDYTLGQLVAAATTTVSVDEPFVKQRIEFTGVPLADLFTAAGITDQTNVDTVALNDYAYDAPASVFSDSDAVLAVRQGGGDIPIDQGGPIRIIFPDGTSGSSNLEAWNWSLRRIEAI